MRGRDGQSPHHRGQWKAWVRMLPSPTFVGAYKLCGCVCSSPQPLHTFNFWTSPCLICIIFTEDHKIPWIWHNHILNGNFVWLLKTMLSTFFRNMYLWSHNCIHNLKHLKNIKTSWSSWSPASSWSEMKWNWLKSNRTMGPSGLQWGSVGLTCTHSPSSSSSSPSFLSSSSWKIASI